MVMVALVWGLHRSTPETARLLPKGMKAVMAIDVVELAGKNEAALEVWKQRLQRAFETDDPGIDWSATIYLFVAPDGNIGMGVPLNDADRWEQTVAGMARRGRCEPVKKQRGLRWTVFDGRWVAAFDADRLLVMGPVMGSAADVLRGQMAELLKQDADESGISSPLFTLLQEQKGPMVLAASPDALPVAYTKPLKSVLPDGIRLADVRLAASVEIRADGVAIRVGLSSENPALKKNAYEMSGWLRPLKGDLEPGAPEHPVARVAANVSGKELLDRLRKNPEWRLFLLMLNQGVDVDLMLKSIDGDVNLSLEALDSNLSIPLVLTARLSSTDFLENADYWERSLRSQSEMTFARQGPDRFYFGMGTWGAWFGVKNRCLYVTTDERLVNGALEVPRDKENTRLRRAMKGKRLYVEVDMQQLMAQAAGLMHAPAENPSGNPVPEPLQSLSTMVLTMDDPLHLTLELKTAEGAPPFYEWFR